MILAALVVITTIWGNIDFYTNHYIVVDGKRYNFAKNVIIDTYSLQPDKKGNVRVELDPSGNAKEVFFYGVDMPQVIKRFKR
jgi:hypothetical protein